MFWTVAIITFLFHCETENAEISSITVLQLLVWLVCFYFLPTPPPFFFFFFRIPSKFSLKTVTSSFSQKAKCYQLAAWVFFVVCVGGFFCVCVCGFVYFVKVSISQWKLLGLWMLGCIVLCISLCIYFISGCSHMHYATKSVVLPPQKCAWRSEMKLFSGSAFHFRFCFYYFKII